MSSISKDSPTQQNGFYEAILCSQHQPYHIIEQKGSTYQEQDNTDNGSGRNGNEPGLEYLLGYPAVNT